MLLLDILNGDYQYFILKTSNKIKYLLLRPLGYARSVGVEVGINTKIMTKCFGTEPYLVTIGNNCEITAGVKFVTHDGGVWVVRNIYKEFECIDILKPIKLNNNIYIGNDAIVLPGVEIASNVIVGAGSIITKDIVDSGVYAGVPAKYICSIGQYIDKNKKNFCLTKKYKYFDKKKYYEDKYDGLE